MRPARSLCADVPSNGERLVTDQLNAAKVRRIVEAALMAADDPLSAKRLAGLFRSEALAGEQVRQWVREALDSLAEDAAAHGYELKQVATGFRFQIRQELSPWVSRLWEDKPPRYSRALLETLALIVYKQPVTRADIEHIRGVGVSQSIMRTLLERGWIHVIGQREVPGRPNLYGSTRAFLDYFNLKSLNELPSLEEVEKKIEPLADEGNEMTAIETADAAAEQLSDYEDALTADPDTAETPGSSEAATEDPNSAKVVRLPTAKR